jgi:ABC-type enterobactin transport system permease subunit
MYCKILNGFRIHAHPAQPQSIRDNCQAKRNMVGEAISETRAAGIAVEYQRNHLTSIVGRTITARSLTITAEQVVYPVAFVHLAKPESARRS